MLSFRQKIILSDLTLFIVFMALLFPFVERTVGNIMRSSMEEGADELIEQLKQASTASGMIGLLESDGRFFFQRITLLDADANLLYDSHVLQGGKPIVRAAMTDLSPEIEQALLYGRGHSESYSEVFHETLSYVSVSFKAHGEKYVLRIGFPFYEIRQLTVAFEKGFILLGFVALLLYSIMLWAVTYRLTRPIHQLIAQISPYQEGHEELFPKIVISSSFPNDEFGKLARTLNSLSSKIQRQIEELTQKSRETEGILESLAEGVIALDISGKITFANDAACRILTASHGAILGRALCELDMRTDDLCRKSHELVVQVLQTSEPAAKLQFGSYLESSDGHRTKVYLDLIAAPLSLHNGAILVLQDKTSNYKMLEMGKDFIANASHELRTPITIIRGFSETLQDVQHLSKEQIEIITHKISHTCIRLDALIKSLLTLSDVENLSEDKFRATDLVAIADNCTHLLISAHKDVQIQFSSDIEKGMILADSDLIDLAIMNILENAVKYSSSPARIQMHLQKDGYKLRLDIRDVGIGIPELDLPHIFNRFYTVDKARSRKSGGAGLGLSIVKTIIDKHRGSITAASEPSKGSVFTLTLPVL